MYDIFNVAYTVCDLADWSLTNRKLQSLMYIIKMVSVAQRVRANNPRSYFFDYFKPQNSEVAPIVEVNLDDRFNSFGLNVLPRWGFMGYEKIGQKDSFIDILVGIVHDMSRWSEESLAQLLMDKYGAWCKHYASKNSFVGSISKEQMFEEYCSRLHYEG
jgi:hypothetical protein